MHLPGASLSSHQLIHSDDRDPDEDERNHEPAQSQAPDWVLDRSIGGGHKSYERPDQDHLDKKVIGEHNIQSYSNRAFITHLLSAPCTLYVCSATTTLITVYCESTLFCHLL